jgi:hypothetical protein
MCQLFCYNHFLISSLKNAPDTHFSVRYPTRYFGSGETGMNGSSNPNHENHTLSEGPPPYGLSKGRRQSLYRMERKATIPSSKLNTTIFPGNAQSQAKRSRGFHPRRCGSPRNAITPEQVMSHYRAQRRGGPGGQALSSPSSASTPEGFP